MTEENDTLCISCKKACKGTDRCTWAGALIPVDGWEAETTKNGYRVIKCPQYSPGRGLPHDIDTDGMMRLLQAAVYQMKEDYLHGIDIYSEDSDSRRKNDKESEIDRKKRNRKTIEHWLIHGGAELLELSDPEEVIQMLRKMARKHDEQLAKLLMR